MSGVNNNPAGAAQGQQNSGNLQPTGAPSQTTATNIQTGSPVTQDQNESTEVLLNQGLRQSNLQVVSAPYSTSSSTAPYTGPNVVTPGGSGGGPSLALIIIGGVIVLLSVAAWNKYIKTPVPARGTKRR